VKKEVVYQYVGGPLDGAPDAPHSEEPFLLVKHHDEWYVYRWVGKGYWEFMGLEAHRCLACDAIVEVARSAQCPLCGAVPVR
jgi:hypothetical protein